MPRRSDTGFGDGLDLFLDAISNVFGGIVFVAMIVVLLLQATPEQPAPRPSAEERGGRAAQLRVLRQQIAALEAVADSRGGDPSVAADLTPLLDRQRAIHGAVVEQQRRVEALRQREEELASEARGLEARLSEAHDALIEAQRVLDAERAEREGRVRLPRFRPSEKAELPVLVAAGRAAPLFGGDGRLNEAEVEVVPPGDRVRLRAGAGSVITPTNAAAEAARLTRGLDPASAYVALAAWEDAFAEAVLLRDALIERGFDYNLVLLERGEAVPTAAEGGVQ